MATKTKKARFTGTKAALLRLAKSVGSLFASGLALMIYHGEATGLTITATLVAGAAFAALVYAAVRLED